MKKTNHNLFITNHRKKDSEISENEFYSTHPDSVQCFLNEFKLPTTFKILEPCCGLGNISRVLVQNGYDVISTDLVDRGYYQMTDIGKTFLSADFFNIKTLNPEIKVIMTNPPFSLAEQMIRHALNILPTDGYLIMYLKLTFLEGKKRFKLFQDFPPQTIYIHSSRQGCSPKGELNFKNGGSVAFCWWIWKKNWNGNTVIKWLPPNS